MRAFHYFDDPTPALAERLPSWLWLIMWPQKSRGADVWRWHDDAFFVHPRIGRFPWPYDTAMRSSVMGFDPERFQELESKFAPTVYWLHQVESGTFFKGGYRQSYNASARPIIVAQQHYIIHRSLPYPYEGLFGRLWLQMGGSLAADHVVCNSDHTLTMLKESFGEWLSPAVLEALLAKTSTLKFGLVAPSLLDAPVAASPKPIVLYNHRFENYKLPDVTAEVLNGLRAGGRNFEVWVTQVLSQKVNKFPVDRAVGHPEQGIYLRNIAVQAVNTLNSVHETFCISALDSLALGHLLVAPKAITFPELVPPDYPFLFTSPEEQTAMLAHIMDTWPKEVEAWAPRLRAFVREHFGLDRYVEAYAELLTTQAARGRVTVPKESTQRSMAKFAKSFKPGLYPIEDVARAFRSATGMQQQASPNRRVVRELTAMGARLEMRRDVLEIRWDGVRPAEAIDTTPK